MYGKILVPVDGSDASQRGLQEAIGIAREQGSQLCLVHIVDELLLDTCGGAGWITEQLLDSVRASGQQILAAAAARAQAAGLRPQCVLVESVGAMAGELIVEQARKSGAELIVIGTHGRRGIRRLALGSDAQAVVRLAAVPVLLVNALAGAGATPPR